MHYATASSLVAIGLALTNPSTLAAPIDPTDQNKASPQPHAPPPNTPMSFPMHDGSAFQTGRFEDPSLLYPSHPSSMRTRTPAAYKSYMERRQLPSVPWQGNAGFDLDDDSLGPDLTVIRRLLTLAPLDKVATLLQGLPTQTVLQYLKLLPVGKVTELLDGGYLSELEGTISGLSGSLLGGIIGQTGAIPGASQGLPNGLPGVPAGLPNTAGSVVPSGLTDTLGGLLGTVNGLIPLHGITDTLDGLPLVGPLVGHLVDSLPLGDLLNSIESPMNSPPSSPIDQVTGIVGQAPTGAVSQALGQAQGVTDNLSGFGGDSVPLSAVHHIVGSRPMVRLPESLGGSVGGLDGFIPGGMPGAASGLVNSPPISPTAFIHGRPVPMNRIPIDPYTGLPISIPQAAGPTTYAPIDPTSGLPYNPFTGLPLVAPNGLPIDPNRLPLPSPPFPGASDTFGHIGAGLPYDSPFPNIPMDPLTSYPYPYYAGYPDAIMGLAEPTPDFQSVQGDLAGSGPLIDPPVNPKKVLPPSSIEIPVTAPDAVVVTPPTPPIPGSLPIGEPTMPVAPPSAAPNPTESLGLPESPFDPFVPVATPSVTTPAAPPSLSDIPVYDPSSPIAPPSVPLAAPVATPVVTPYVPSSWPTTVPSPSDAQVNPAVPVLPVPPTPMSLPVSEVPPPPAVVEAIQGAGKTSK